MQIHKTGVQGGALVIYLRDETPRRLPKVPRLAAIDDGQTLAS